MVSPHLPSWFIDMVNNRPGESPIFIFELCAAVLMARLALEWTSDKQRTCVLCVGNQGAVAALVKGSSSSALGTLLASLFWNLSEKGPILWRIEYVHTKSNDADAPSRWCTSNFGESCAHHSGDVPTAFSVAFSSWDSLRREATVFNNGKINWVRYLSYSRGRFAARLN